MSVSAKMTSTMSVAGVSITSVYDREEESAERVSIAIPAGLAGTLSTRTDANNGVLTVATGHGLTTSDTITIAWASGAKTNAAITATTGTTITFESTAGTDLPVANTAVVVSKKVSHNMFFNGTSLVMFGMTSTQRSFAEFVDGSSSVIDNFEVAEREGRTWVKDTDVTNPFGTSVVGSVRVSNGTTTAATLQIGLLKSSN